MHAGACTSCAGAGSGCCTEGAAGGAGAEARAADVEHKAARSAAAIGEQLGGKGQHQPAL